MRYLTMEPRALTRKLANVLVALAATLGAAMLLSGCITVPAGTEKAFDANSVLVLEIAKDQEIETEEQGVFFAGLKSVRRSELFGEMFDAVAADLSETTDTLALRPEFIAYGFEVEGKIRAFDSPLDRWQARGKARAALAREAAKNSADTLAALKAAQITLKPEVQE